MWAISVMSNVEYGLCSWCRHFALLSAGHWSYLVSLNELIGWMASWFISSLRFLLVCLSFLRPPEEELMETSSFKVLKLEIYCWCAAKVLHKSHSWHFRDKRFLRLVCTYTSAVLLEERQWLQIIVCSSKVPKTGKMGSTSLPQSISFYLNFKL